MIEELVAPVQQFACCVILRPGVRLRGGGQVVIGPFDRRAGPLVGVVGGVNCSPLCECELFTGMVAPMEAVGRKGR